jgi:hypothetical protein
MRLELRNLGQARQFERCSIANLMTQVRKLKNQLLRGNKYGLIIAYRSNFLTIEVVAARFGFRKYSSKIIVDCRDRRGMTAKSLQLRMMLVPASCPSKYGTSKESFAPHRNQCSLIKVGRMNTPQSQTIDLFKVGNKRTLALTANPTMHDGRFPARIRHSVGFFTAHCTCRPNPSSPFSDVHNRALTHAQPCRAPHRGPRRFP